MDRQCEAEGRGNPLSLRAIALDCRVVPEQVRGASKKGAWSGFSGAASGYRQPLIPSLSAAQLFRRNNDASPQPMDIARQKRPDGAANPVILRDKIWTTLHLEEDQGVLSASATLRL